MTIGRCVCGATWAQHGNQSGHCAACHETFSSNFAFELHRRIKDGRAYCVHPGKVLNRKGMALLEARTDSLGTTQWGQRSRPVPAAWA